MQFPWWLPETFIRRVGDWFGSIGDFFKDWGDYLGGYLLFQHTIAPVFHGFADACYNLRNWFHAGDDLIAKTWWTAWQVVEGWLIGDIIRERLPVLWEFYQDAWGYIRNLVGAILGIPEYTRWFPHLWIDYLISKVFPDWALLKTDPTGFIIGRLTAWYPLIVAFFDDPLRKVRWWMADILGIPWSLRDLPWYWPGEILDRFFYGWRELAQDPWGYLKGMIYAGTPTLRWVFDDPLEWLWR